MKRNRRQFQKHKKGEGVADYDLPAKVIAVSVTVILCAIAFCYTYVSSSTISEEQLVAVDVTLTKEPDYKRYRRRIELLLPTDALPEPIQVSGHQYAAINHQVVPYLKAGDPLTLKIRKNELTDFRNGEAVDLYEVYASGKTLLSLHKLNTERKAQRPGAYAFSLCLLALIPFMRLQKAPKGLEWMMFAAIVVWGGVLYAVFKAFLG